MKIKFTKPTIYMSHSVRGDNNDIKRNCDKAKRVADKIRRCFPDIDIYCPADHDLCIQVLWKSDNLTEKQIIKADLEILRHCHGWFWWYTSPSKGCEEEHETAMELGLTDCVEDVISIDLLKANFSELRRIFTPIVEKAKERYRNGGTDV